MDEHVADEDEAERAALALIRDAARTPGATVHIEPIGRESARVRLPDDVRPLDPREYETLCRGLFQLSCLDWNDRRLPQDGKIRLRLEGDRLVEVRVSTMPEMRGSRVVIRAYDPDAAGIELDRLGFEDEVLRALEEKLRRRWGLILIAGPSGSGRTTTMHALMQRAAAPDVTICAAEDPVERFVPGVSHVQCRPDLGLTHAAALRTMRRQDADVYVVSEIRDYETAEQAIKIAIAGRLVIGGIHTGDAASAYGLLANMGVEHYLIVEAGVTVLAQRLARTLCTECRTAYRPGPDGLASVGLDIHPWRQLGLARPPAAALELFRAPGCAACKGRGTRGRTGVHELLVPSRRLQACVLKGGSPEDLRRTARAGGMRTLRESALRKALLGQLSLDEVLRVAPGQVG